MIKWKIFRLPNPFSAYLKMLVTASIWDEIESHCSFYLHLFDI